MSIKSKIYAIISDRLNVPLERIKPESTFKELDADDLDKTEVVMQIEDECKVEISDDEADKIHTVGELVGYVEEAQP